MACPRLNQLRDFWLSARERVDGRIPGAREPGNERWQAHLAQCRDCRMEWDALEALSQAFRRGFPPPTVDPAFLAGLRSALAREIRQPARPAGMGPRIAKFLDRLSVPFAAPAPRWAGLAWTGMLAMAAATLFFALRALGPGPGAPGETWKLPVARSDSLSQANSPWVAGDAVYVLAGNGGAPQVMALDARRGRPLWRSRERSLGYLAGDGVRLYGLDLAPGGALALAGYSAGDGRLLWRFQPPSPASPAHSFPSRPLPLGATVGWSEGTRFFCLDGGTGRLLWARNLDGQASRAVAAGGRIYLATHGSLQVLDPADGRLLARRDFPDGWESPARPQLAWCDGKLLLSRSLGVGRASLECLTGDGTSLWRTETAAAAGLLAADGMVFVRAGAVRAYALATGGLVWTADAMGCSPLSYGDGKLYLADARERHSLLALDPRTGRRLWSDPDLHSCGALAIAGGRAFLSASDGYLHALDLSKLGTRGRHDPRQGRPAAAPGPLRRADARPGNFRATVT